MATTLGDGNVTASGVVRGDTVRAASLAKFEIGTTTKTSDLSTELAAKRDRTDNTCHQTTSGFTSWQANLPTDHEWDDQPSFSTTANKWIWGSSSEDVEGNSSDPDATSVTFSYTVVEETKSFTATRTANAQIATADKTYTTNDYVDKKVGSFSPVGGVTPTVTSGVANLSSLFSSDNTSLMGVCRYATADAITTTTQMADRTVNPVTLTTNTVELTFPAAVTDKVRDFLIYIDASAWTTGTLTITKPTGSSTIGDSFPSITATCKYLVAVTEVTSGMFYVRSIKIS